MMAAMVEAQPSLIGTTHGGHATPPLSLALPRSHLLSRWLGMAEQAG